MALAAPPRKAGRPGVLVTFPKHELVGRLMEYQEAVRLALIDNGAAWQYAAASAQDPQSPAGAMEACRVLRDQRTGLTALLSALRDESGDFDGRAA